MLGSKALRTCSVCRDKLRSVRLGSIQAGPSRAINTQSNSIDDSVFTSHPLTDPTPGYGLVNKLDGGRGVEEEDEEWVPREERRSPAAVFGSKRVGLEVVPRRMEENIQSEINSMSRPQLSTTICPLSHLWSLYHGPMSTWDGPGIFGGASYRGREADVRSPPPRNSRSIPIFPNDIYETEIETWTI